MVNTFIRPFIACLNKFPKVSVPRFFISRVRNLRMTILIAGLLLIIVLAHGRYFLQTPKILFALITLVENSSFSLLF